MPRARKSTINMVIKLIELSAAVTGIVTAILWIWTRLIRAADDVKQSGKHPRPRRLLWNPIFPAIFSIYFVERIWRFGFALASARTGGLVVAVIWLVLAIFDL